ncbi:MAG: sodium:proton antiporter [Ignisphaera sp.]|nr:sodium:proton antiporter [Ignisphaera sp.]MCX8167639.1 sodium:proton antiporter [Ignisphaera sp.]MDW8085950.1 MnhB domain-containing protein [Ignisphaera sp.]
MNRKDIALALSLSLLVLALSLTISLEGLGPIVPRELRPLGASFVQNSYNPWNASLTSLSLNVVTAIVWDYRGLDTLYETLVLFASIAATLVVLRGYSELSGLGIKGLSDVSKSVTVVIAPLIVVYGIATAIHGHLTPGGGFQGGTIAVVAATLIIAVFSLEYLYRRGVSTSRLMLLRILGLLAIILTSLSLASIGMPSNVNAYILQNMAKDDSALSMPGVLFDTPLAGSIFLYNLFEFIIVFSGLTFAAMMLVLRESELESIKEAAEVYE